MSCKSPTRPCPGIRLGQRYRNGSRALRVIAVGPQFGPPGQSRIYVLGLDDRGRQAVVPVRKFMHRYSAPSN